ncbi:NB-ARC domain-containing protein [uncultured Methylobacterium sp.]|jgi:LuxR family glucitol operon transcriptional activator|uniref:NB-ARC domain-containing protein n=1 Tax=uncultured Methylobacterium sp. TaxID=157278 RepID=UPI002619F440|nr:NB-ARC domain-containing protein [uncultured Methylobacterium sp.]
MIHTIQRLTMYALISALERDLRYFISSNIVISLGGSKLLPDAVRKKASERALKEDPDILHSEEDLIEYLDLSEEIQIIRTHESVLDGSTRAYIKRYYTGLEGLIPIRNRVMHSRPLEFDDLPRVVDLSAELAKSHRVLWANLRGIRQELDRNHDFVTRINIPSVIDETIKILHNLPQTEFDDTGFVGRERELNDLKRALKGSYPVVTIVGEGGLGKTALALKACYDLLDDSSFDLDAIVWTTAKATKLTPNEILVIEGAISSSLGIFDSANEILGRQNADQALLDLIMHLENNKILLVIDNLETVIDQNIRDLVRRVPIGSRILFTTRIGLGAFDFPIPLSPLAKKEASFYFRRAAKVWGVQDLAAASPSVVDGFCEKLQNNPLFIKWFIQSVRAGKRPSTLTNDPLILLQFCLQNVFNALSLDAKAVANTLACVSGPQSIASLAFFTDLDSISIQSALSVLVTSNLVMTERARVSEDEDKYTLSPLARMYLQKFIRPSPDQQKQLIRKQHALRSAKEEYGSRAGLDVFDINYVFIRDKDDYIVARYLSRCIEYRFKEKIDLATDQLQRASDLSPNYFEVHRVRAFLDVAREDYVAAEDSYESAISLAPNRAPLRVWYAGFLSRHLGDNERALEQLIEAERISPDSPTVCIETARILQYLRDFDGARHILSKVSRLEQLPAKTRRVHLDLQIGNEIRAADAEVGKGNHTQGIKFLESAKSIVDSAPKSLMDHRTLKLISRVRRLIPTLERGFRGLPEFSRIEALQDWIAAWNASLGENQQVRYNSSLEPGVIKPHIDMGKNKIIDEPPVSGFLREIYPTYGFIDSGVARLFFHRGNWKGREDYLQLGVGTEVSFDYSFGDRGHIASNVRPKSDTISQASSDVIVRGKTKKIDAGYGFATLDEGNDIFFHRNGCAVGTKFNKLKIGDRIRGRIERRADLKTQLVNVELFSG